MRWIAGYLMLFMLVACTDHKALPDDIIKKEKMEKILWDMLQADRYVSSYVLTRPADSPSVKQEKAAVMYEQVFRLHNITREEFLKSYRFYLGRPDITRVMFDSISARADRQRDKLFRSGTPRSALLSRRDSLLRADSIRRADSIEKIDLAKPSTEDLFRDSVLDKK
jgi:hypothetical protein